jgi:hypothetical protein
MARAELAERAGFGMAPRVFRRLVAVLDEPGTTGERGRDGFRQAGAGAVGNGIEAGMSKFRMHGGGVMPPYASARPAELRECGSCSLFKQCNDESGFSQQEVDVRGLRLYL